MNLFHSTKFESLCSILRDGVLRPVPITDNENKLLASLGVTGVWFSKNSYPNNNLFGPYSFQFQYTNFKDKSIVSLGKINGSQTYLCTDTPFATYVANEIKTKIDKDGDWMKNDKANVIICSHIPISISDNLDTCLSYTDRNGNKTDVFSRNIDLLQGRLLAFIIKVKIINIKIDLNKFSKSLLFSLVGQYNAFQNRQSKNYNNNYNFNDYPNIYNESLDFIIENDIVGARELISNISSIDNIANLISHSIKDNFNIEIKTEDIMKDYT